jgi:dihydroorotate dehydrogenase electron transfer subunit
MFFQARVVENRPLGPGGFLLRLSGCGNLSQARPGQFVMLRGEWGRDPLLPRAFSILRTLPDGECELLIKAMGRGTRLLERAEPGARLDVLGPLGRPFPEPSPERKDVLVAGGVGLAPLLWHAEVAHARGIPTVMCYGARSAADLVLLERIPGELHLATEDGSRGVAGRVTRALETAAATGVTVLTCGPNPMMRAVAEVSRARGLACYVSVEGEMACGIGACLGCAIPTVGATNEDGRPFHYACVDGPVFDATKVVIP